MSGDWPRPCRRRRRARGRGGRGRCPRRRARGATGRRRRRGGPVRSMASTRPSSSRRRDAPRRGDVGQRLVVPGDDLQARLHPAARRSFDAGPDANARGGRRPSARGRRAVLGQVLQQVSAPPRGPGAASRSRCRARACRRSRAWRASSKSKSCLPRGVASAPRVRRAPAQALGVEVVAAAEQQTVHAVQESRDVAGTAASMAASWPPVAILGWLVPFPFGQPDLQYWGPGALPGQPAVLLLALSGRPRPGSGRAPAAGPACPPPAGPGSGGGRHLLRPRRLQPGGALARRRPAGQSAASADQAVAAGGHRCGAPVRHRLRPPAREPRRLAAAADSLSGRRLSRRRRGPLDRRRTGRRCDPGAGASAIRQRIRRFGPGALDDAADRHRSSAGALRLAAASGAAAAATGRSAAPGGSPGDSALPAATAVGHRRHGATAPIHHWRGTSRQGHGWRTAPTTASSDRRASRSAHSRTPACAGASARCTPGSIRPPG